MNYYFENLNYLLNKHQLSLAEFKERNLSHRTEFNDFDELIAVSHYFNIPIEKLLFTKLELSEKFAEDIKLLVMDVDGVLTDGGMYYLSNGEEIKKFNTKDGYAIMQLQKKGIKTAFLSSGFRQEIIETRAKLLNIDFVYVGRENKIDILDKWLNELNISFKNIAYIGDDLNDAEIMKRAGVSACPADASNEIKIIADIILKSKGGEACVREFIDAYMI